MGKQVVVVGLGSLGASLAETLNNIGHEVLVLDKREAVVQEIASRVTQAIQVDPTSESSLKSLGVGNFEIGVVTLADIEESVLATILLKKLGVRYVISTAISDLHGTILEKVGADKVVYPEREMGAGIAYVLTLGDVIDYIPVTSGYGVVKMSAPSYYIGKTLSELGFGHRGKWEVVVLLLQRKQDILINPAGTEMLRAEDVLVVSGNWDKLEDLFSHMQKTEPGK